jgi:hypothetical protein
MTFEATHGVSCDTGINHPNQYFSESQKVLRAKVSVTVYYTCVLSYFYQHELVFCKLTSVTQSTEPNSTGPISSINYAQCPSPTRYQVSVRPICSVASLLGILSSTVKC